MKIRVEKVVSVGDGSVEPCRRGSSGLSAEPGPRRLPGARASAQDPSLIPYAAQRTLHCPLLPALFLCIFQLLSPKPEL